MKMLQPLLEKYKGNRVIRGLIQLVPFGIGGAIDVILVETLNNIQHERATAFFDELATGNIVVDENLLRSEDFLHCYFSSAKYALNSRRREKIKMFARLLKSSLSEEGPKSVDEYEDFLKILDELSYRELLALSILDEYSNRPREEEHNDLQWTNTFWSEFEKRLPQELLIPAEEIAGFMDRISRTGCYEMFKGGYWDYEGGKGKLTPIYHRLKRFILDSETKG
jgi:hypothetical protein